MIFVTVGSHPTFCFQRLLDALDSLAGYELVVQHGPGLMPASVRSTGAPWLTFDDMNRRMGAADAVVSHAGAGTIIAARQRGHIPVVVPRLLRFRETVDDHQRELCQALEPTGAVLVAWDVSDIATLVASAIELRGSRPMVNSGLLHAVRAELDKTMTTRAQCSGSPGRTQTRARRRYSLPTRGLSEKPLFVAARRAIGKHLGHRSR